MVVSTEQRKADLIANALELVRHKLQPEKARLTETFLTQFYANVPPADICLHNADNLYGSALAFLDFAQQRQPNQTIIRVYNPSYSDFGWKSPHTIIEIVAADKPFLVDSITSSLGREDYGLHLITHPILAVKRDANGQLQDIAPEAETDQGQGWQFESFMRVEIDQQSAEDSLALIHEEVEKVMADVTICVSDWPEMRQKADAVEQSLLAYSKQEDDEAHEAHAFLKWMQDDHFLFMGYREYYYEGDGESFSPHVVAGSGLGILRDDSFSVFEGLRHAKQMTENMRDFVQRPVLLQINKANQRSRVHRNVHLDSVVVKILNDSGDVVGEKLFLGLFTSSAYSRNPRVIPVLRKRIASIIAQSGLKLESHDGKALLHILSNYPRDELFQATEADLLRISRGILDLQERHQVALFTRLDPLERFVSCLVFVPRDRFNTKLRLKFQKILGQAYSGTVTAFYTHLTDEVLARIHFVIKTTPGAIPATSASDVEVKLIDAARSWEDMLKSALVEEQGEEQGLRLFRRYEDAFSSNYREKFNAQDGLGDIRVIENLSPQQPFDVALYRPLGADQSHLQIKVFNCGHSVALSDMLPVIEHMGLRVLGEIPYEVEFDDDSEGYKNPGNVWINDFQVQPVSGKNIDLVQSRAQFEDAFKRVWGKQVEDDGLNSLVLVAGLTWRDCVIMRCYVKFLRQTGMAFSQLYMEEALAQNVEITKSLVRLFKDRFDPAGDQQRADAIAATEQHILELLDQVSNLDEDRILRAFLSLIQSTLRTNAYQLDAAGQIKSYVSIKLKSSEIDFLPKPRPYREIFVYSPRMEGVHLRGGKVARGGIRWSDRREDFRTEILGLVKAQMVKNAVIVPVGSKGGFVVKHPPKTGGREAFINEGIACYKILMSGLLDLTDNYSAGEIIVPKQVVCHDDPDPYLVVAADKGTATFSDIANSVSEEYGFWLGDAFASGGSAGYDHKKMGITARGAWEAVKRHFREMGKDIQSEDFTCVGIGDMSGDVFGNGMLLSRHIRLQAAFNHMHIFVDPTPDAATSYVERQRLFDLPRSSWTDYNTDLLSPGGQIYERSAKSLTLTPEIQKAFGISEKIVTPNQLIMAILKTEIDLLWFGGIGTYLKSTSETHADCGDRANDAIRINAHEAGAKVIGEGANLGVTQKARIEFCLNGGRMNTDAVDNSAGVDCSDHEVNIKILLGDIEQKGDLTRKQRDELLESMTDEVAQLVLRDNYLQTQALTEMARLGVRQLDSQQRLIRQLEREGRLDRAIEFLPDDEEIAERRARRQGLTRPELSVLLAYAKLAIYDALMESDLPDDPLLEADLLRYFPKVLTEKFAEGIKNHQLRREIIATFATNSMVNRVGATFVSDMVERTGKSVPEIARAYAIVRDAFELRPLWQQVEALDLKVASETQHRLYHEMIRLINRVTIWFLRNGTSPLDIHGNVSNYQPGLRKLAERLSDIMSEENRKVVDKRQKGFQEQQVPDDLAKRIASLTQLSPGCDIVGIADGTGLSVDHVGDVYFTLGTTLGFDWLRTMASGLPCDTQWQDMAVSAIIEDLVSHQVSLTGQIIKVTDQAVSTNMGGDVTGDAALSEWVLTVGQETALDRTKEMLTEMRAAGSADFPMLAVANRQLRVLVKA